MFSVSIILPNYNHSAYLEERIESILNQTYKNFELIILDDKSTDNSVEIIEKYRYHPKVTHIEINKINSGSTFRQWDKGISLATGDYIWIAESDDWCEYTFLETLMNTVNNKKNISIALCQSLFYYNETGEFKFINNNVQKDCFFLPETSLENYFFPFNPIYNASMAIFKKEYYFLVSSEYTTYKCCGDWIFWTELSRHGPVYVSGKHLNYFRHHDNKISKISFKKGIVNEEELKAIKYIAEKYKLNEILIKRAIYEHYSQFFYVKDLLDNNTSNYLKNLYERNLYFRDIIRLRINYYLKEYYLKLKQIVG